MNIGILNTPSTFKQGGGQYALTTIEALIQNSQYKFYVINPDSQSDKYESENVKQLYLDSKETELQKILKKICLLFGYPLRNRLYRQLDRLNLDLIISLPAASLFGLYVGIPQIVCIHDMMFNFYSDLPEFPLQVRLKRRYVYKKAAKNAVFCIVDSECGKKHVKQFTSLSEKRIKVIPFSAPPYINKYRRMGRSSIDALLSKYHLPEDFIFYPAQYWKHKNHERLIHAIHLIKVKYGQKIPVVFAGSDRGNFTNIKSLIQRLNLEPQFHVLNYVLDKTIVALYKRASALVFPSLFGPTNLPIAEALVLGIPIIYSGIFGMPEQVGEAGIMFDPFDPSDIAEKIHQVWSNPSMQRSLSAKAIEKSKSISASKYQKLWADVLRDACQVLSKPNFSFDGRKS